MRDMAVLNAGAEEEENLEGAAEGGAPAATKNTTTVHQRVHGGKGLKGRAGGRTESRSRSRTWEYNVCFRAPSHHNRCSGTYRLWHGWRGEQRRGTRRAARRGWRRSKFLFFSPPDNDASPLVYRIQTHGAVLFCFCFQEEEDDDEEEGSEEEADGEEDEYPKLPQVGTILYRDGPQPPQQPPLPPSPQTQPQPPPLPLQAAFVPIQPLPDYNPADYPGSTSPEMQRVLAGQQMLSQQQQGQGQQLPGLGPGMIPQQAPDGLMVATPAQTLTDTLDDIMAGKCKSIGRKPLIILTKCKTAITLTCIFGYVFFFSPSCSCEQPGAHAEHYNFTHTLVTATHTDARQHRLSPFSPAPVPFCWHRCTCKMENHDYMMNIAHERAYICDQSNCIAKRCCLCT